MNCKRIYNLLRNRVQRELKKSKQKYYAEYFAEQHKKMWEGIRKIVNIKNISTKSSHLNIGGKFIDGDKELATNFNKFFVNVASSTEKTIPMVPNVSPSKFLRNHNQTNFIIAHI